MNDHKATEPPYVIDMNADLGPAGVERRLDPYQIAEPLDPADSALVERVLSEIRQHKPAG